jgi:hypothetical protein
MQKSTMLVKKFSVNRHLFSHGFPIIETNKNVGTGDGNGTLLDLFAK